MTFHSPPFSRSIPPGKDNRAGVAAVEFAMILPVIMLIFFACLQVSNVLSLQTNVTAISHQAALAVSKSNNTFQDVRDRYEMYAQSAGLKQLSVNLSRTNADTVEIVVSIPAAPNSLLSAATDNRIVSHSSYVYRDPAAID